MILDDDNTIIEESRSLALVQKSIDIFTECYTVDRDLKSDDEYKGYWGAGAYDIDKVRRFYTAKEPKFRKRLKEIGFHASIWKDFGSSSKDTITYNFYYGSTFMYRITLEFMGKVAVYGTYKTLMYRVETNPGQLLESSMEEINQSLRRYKSKLI